MKKSNLTLSLNKVTIANLNAKELKTLYGGTVRRPTGRADGHTPEPTYSECGRTCKVDPNI